MEIKECCDLCTLEGNVLKLPSFQMDRKDYLTLKKYIEFIGGKWNSKSSGFVFKKYVPSSIEEIVKMCEVDPKGDLQFFETPLEVVEQLLEHADIQNGNWILEPSAGRGAIAKVIIERYPLVHVNACEISPVNRSYLKDIGGLKMIRDNDFLSASMERQYDRIVANPPFAKNMDIKHVYRMYEFLKPGGRIVTVMSTHFQFTKNKTETAFRKWLDDLGDVQILDIEDRAFHESGTDVKACMIVIDKPVGSR
jgi:hypothetical protein